MPAVKYPSFNHKKSTFLPNSYCFMMKKRPFKVQNMAFCHTKHGLLCCKRPCFTS